MRLSVASTGGATGSGSVGFAACFSAAYSFTGSTTQPSGGGGPLCAKLEAVQMKNKVVESSKRSRFMENLLWQIRVQADFETQRHGRRKKLARTFVRDETGVRSLWVKPCL